MDNIELQGKFREIISYLVSKRQETAARAVLQGALLVVDSASIRAELAGLVGGTTNVGVVGATETGRKAYAKLDLGASSAVQKKTAESLGRQVQRLTIGGVAASEGVTGAITKKGGAISFRDSGIKLEKPYVSPDEVEYENGGEFREFADGFEDLEGEGSEGEDGADNVGIDQDGKPFEVVDGGDVALKKMVRGIRGRKKGGL